jgi:uncharacterized membrane protein YgdD (TMEM256/DUF423 family)
VTGPEPASNSFARRCIVAGALLMLVGLVLGAVGAHVVADRVSARQFDSFETAVLYQLLHALALILVGVLARSTTATSWLRWSGRLMALGIACFSGSIYLGTAGVQGPLAHIAPFGGTSLMAAWAMLALHAVTYRRE